MAGLAFLFFITALLYASVGFGGGSTYNALLVLSDVDHRVLPAVALTCNIAVVLGGTFRFWRSGHLRAGRLLPFLATSVPAAWAGGRLPVSETVFIGVLSTALLASGLHLLFDRGDPVTEKRSYQGRTLPLLIGLILGLVAGIAGIGGGIFLAPVLYHLRWGRPREIAAAASLFILVNSVSGLIGQMMKLAAAEETTALLGYWPLLPAVIIGGQIGSHLASGSLPPVFIRRATAVLVLFVAVRLFLRLFK